MPHDETPSPELTEVPLEQSPEKLDFDYALVDRRLRDADYPPWRVSQILRIRQERQKARAAVKPPGRA